MGSVEWDMKILLKWEQTLQIPAYDLYDLSRSASFML